MDSIVAITTALAKEIKAKKKSCSHPKQNEGDLQKARARPFYVHDIHNAGACSVLRERARFSGSKSALFCFSVWRRAERRRSFGVRASGSDLAEAELRCAELRRGVACRQVAAYSRDVLKFARATSAAGMGMCGRCVAGGGEQTTAARAASDAQATHTVNAASLRAAASVGGCGRV